MLSAPIKEGWNVSGSTGWMSDLRLLHPLWFYNAVTYLALAGFCLVASWIDERTLIGVSVWTKPFKFALSISIYFATLAWCARFIAPETFRRSSVRVMVWIPVVMSLFEMSYIFFQASIGEPSHFNNSTPFHTIMYSLMGFGAVCMVAVLVWYAVLIARQNSLAEPLIFAVVAGLILTFILGGGFGGYLGGAGGHWVGGAATDAGGMPVVNWSTSGGDLRVAHFFGMHAMQALPLFALLLPQQLSRGSGVALVAVFGCIYAALTVMTFVQAISGQPLLAL